MNYNIQVGIIGFIAIRFIFWIGGVDLLERSIHAGFATFMSMMVGIMAAAIYQDIRRQDDT